MEKKRIKPRAIQSITELHALLTIPPPEHPLVSVIDFSEITCFSDESLRSVSYHFYCIALKKGFRGKMQYGQNFYDFDEGVMTFFAPGQVVTTDLAENVSLSGWWLVVHPAFINSSSLTRRINDYGYFSYAVNEALHLSEKEEKLVGTIMENIRQECGASIDLHGQEIILSHIDLLLSYCNRFYSRQFITRKQGGDDLLSRLDVVLSAYFERDSIQEKGIPTVQHVADELHVSAHYLSDMLRTLTGQNTQQHIHNKLIDKAIALITTSSLSISEIAYQLGFEHSQSFNKLFKQKTNQTPLSFRRSLN